MIAGDGSSQDRDALRRAFERHRLRLFRLAVLLLGDPTAAEDVVQDVFVRAIPRIGALQEEDVYPYLHRSVVNAWKNEVRHRKVVAGEWHTDGDGMGDPEEVYALWLEILKLPARQRACLVLRYYEDLDDPEIASLLGCRVGTVRSQTSRAIAKLRKASPP